MTNQPDTQTARRCFKAVIGLAICLILSGHMWLASYSASNVDGILSQEEMQDAKLIDVVYRTHKSIDARLLVSDYVCAALLILTSYTGLGSLRKQE